MPQRFNSLATRRAKMRSGVTERRRLPRHLDRRPQRTGNRQRFFRRRPRDEHREPAQAVLDDPRCSCTKSRHAGVVSAGRNASAINRDRAARGSPPSPHSSTSQPRRVQLLEQLPHAVLRMPGLRRLPRLAIEPQVDARQTRRRRSACTRSYAATPPSPARYPSNRRRSPESSAATPPNAAPPAASAASRCVAGSDAFSAASNAGHCSVRIARN